MEFFGNLLIQLQELTSSEQLFALVSSVSDNVFCTSMEWYMWFVAYIGQKQITFYTFVTFFHVLFAIFHQNFPTLKSEEFYATPRDQLLSNYDFIIVGGGTAGCLMANRLSADPRYKVLLIEGGGVPNVFSQVPALINLNQNNPYSGLDWMYFSEPQTIGFQRMHEVNGHPKRCHMGGGKGLGGSSHINFQMFSRAHKEDFDRWERVYGAHGWGSAEMWQHMRNYEETLDAQLRLQTADHGIDGEFQVSLAPVEHNEALIDTFIDAGAAVTGTKRILDHNDGLSQGFARLQTTVNAIGFSSNSVRSFLEPIREARPNLHIMLHSLVSKTLFNGTTAIGVVVQPEGGSDPSIAFEEQTFYANREVILSAGAARSPQILLLSGVGPKEELDRFNISQVAEAPVGSNLHDHITLLGLNAVFPEGKGYRDLSLREIWKFFTNHTGALRVPGTAQAVAFFSSNVSTDARPDVELILVAGSPNREAMRLFLNAIGVSDEDFSSYFEAWDQGSDPQGIFVAPVMLHSPTRGRLRLRSTSIADHPVFDIQYLSNQHDLDFFVDTARTVKRIIEQFSSYHGGRFTSSTVPGCEQFADDKDSREYIECHAKSYTVSIWHMAGTCSMGTGPGSVVDPRLRVRGVSRLRVIDASVIPEETTGHMVATIYAMAEKASKMILEDQASVSVGQEGGTNEIK